MGEQLTSQQRININLASGLFTGMFCSGLFNPWDRALYLSVKYKRPFLCRENFHAPYQGISQAIVQRAFLGGVYFFFQSELKHHMYPYLHDKLGFGESTTQFFVGLTAGALSGVSTNSVSAIKYHTWGQQNPSFFSAMRAMKLAGGYAPFIKGTRATMLRDISFGSTYEFLRHLAPQFQNQSSASNQCVEWAGNAIAAGVATVVSGPFNYARTLQYATRPHLKPPKITEALVGLWSESKNYSSQRLGRLGFFQQRLCIGWGTLRVASGMAVSQKIFDLAKEKLSEYVETTNVDSYKKG